MLSDSSYEHPAIKTNGSSSGVSSDVSDSENDHDHSEHDHSDHCGISDPGSPSKGGGVSKRGVLEMVLFEKLYKLQLEFVPE